MTGLLDAQMTDLQRRAKYVPWAGLFAGLGGDPGYGAKLGGVLGKERLGLLDAQLEQQTAQQERDDLMRQGAQMRGAAQGFNSAGLLSGPNTYAFNQLPAEDQAGVLSGWLKDRQLSPGDMLQIGLDPNAFTQNLPTELQTEFGRINAARGDQGYLSDLNTVTMAGAGPTSVGAGSSLVNPGTGRAMYSQPTARTQEHRSGVRTETQSAKDQEIARLMSQGLDRVTAERLADGHVRMVTDPVTGRTSVVDMVDGRGNFVQIDRPGQEQGVSAQGPAASVTPGVDVQTLTEIPGAARRLANKVSDVIGIGPVSQPTAEAAADMRQWYQLGRLRLASAITDDRRSNMVLEMLDDVFINPDKLFMGGEDTLLKLESLDRSLGQISSEFDQVLGNPYSSSVKDVQSAENRKRMIDSVREDIRVMVEGYGQRGANVEGAAPDAGAVQDGYQFLGGDPADPSRWRKVE